ncbi:MAG: preprotein translocase subunit YajC [Marinobacter sp.]|nr:preprotein translocase subunit YajC [Marinobacter sp.]
MSVMGQIIFFGGFILIFYLLIWRPQSKRAKEHKTLMSGLNKGDEVVISGGLAGKITKVADDFIVLEVADKVEVKVQKVAVAVALPKGTLKDV